MKTFEQTSEQPYDLHWYKLVMKDGREHKLECYEQVKYFWYRWRKYADRIEVMDTPKKKEAPKGF